jgi:5-methylcytosine-specific restriction protein A
MALEHALLDSVTRLVEHVSGSRPLPEAAGSSITAGTRMIGEVRQLLDALGAEFGGQVAVRSPGFTEDSIARQLGEKSAAAAVAMLACIEPGEARDWCVAGEAVAPRVSLQGEALPHRYPYVAPALLSGGLSPRAARAIIEALAAVSARVTSAELLDVEEILVEHAPRLTARAVDKLCRQVIDRFDPDGAEPREDELRAQSGIKVIRGRDGLVTWIVKMHPEAAGFMTTAVDARTAPRREVAFTPEVFTPAVQDDRNLAQRRLDALVSIARESVSNDHGQLAGTSVTMNVTMSLDALISGIGAARIDGVDEPISAATARRLASDAQIIPVVLGGESEPLDLGQSRRLFSEAQRRALAQRDGGCVFTNCMAPPGWCEVAHLTAWAIGGPTDLRNGALMCPFHHRMFDHDGWDFAWDAGGLTLIPPASHSGWHKAA